MSLPSGYTRLEWIESTGTQYVDTGVIPESDSFLVTMTGENRAASLSAENWFMTINSSKPAGTATFLQFGTWNSVFAVHLTNVTVGGNAAANQDPVTLEFKVSGSTATLTGGGETYSVTNGNFSSGPYRNSTITIMGGTWRCTSCQERVGGTLVRDYIPCKNASGVVGLWDDVNSQFYANAGTGSFTAGPEILPPAAPTGLQTVLAVVLAWEAVDGSTGYRLYRDGTLIASTNGLQYVDMAVSPNETYVYSVAAVGTAGEEPAATLTVYTKSGYFEYKPLVQDATFP